MAMATYRDAGVDIDEGDRLVELIAPMAKATARPEVLGDIGGFGGLFALNPGKYQEPVLVSGTDGVGTKLKVAFALDRHDTVGIDLVAMCVNDVAVTGAEPLFFLDYYATGKLSARAAAEVVKGIAEGCRQAGCALIGGETAELPGFYAAGEYDLAGFAVGCVERSRILDGRNIAVGDAVVGIASTGLHSNGFSLARKALEKLPLEKPLGDLDKPLGEVLLTPTRIYSGDALALREAVPLKGLAHITGGGLPGNVPRCLPHGTRAVLQANRWPRPPIFDLIAREGAVAPEEMFRTFNMGLGMVAILSPSATDAAIALLRKRGLQAWVVGEIAKGGGEATCEVVR
jgi:phosphoribosylformylglycinamidine cyclo-ligase